MNEQPDPERLLAEALRAQAVRAPMPAPGAAPDSDPLLKLMSGTDEHPDLLSGRASDTDQTGADYTHTGHTLARTTGVDRPTAVTDSRYTARPAPAPLSVWWIVVLAVLLGLAAGAVVGLVSVV